MKVAAYTGLDWRRAMAAATRPYALCSSPPAESGGETLHRWLMANLPRCEVLALNLHGFPGLQFYQGQADGNVGPIALSVQDVLATAEAWRGLVVFCEVCFSAINRELPQAMYQAGVKAVIGSLTEAYGRTRAALPLPGADGEADRLLSFFLTWYRRRWIGRDPARALRAAKKTLKVWSLPLDREDRATLESFVIIPKEVR